MEMTDNENRIREVTLQNIDLELQAEMKVEQEHQKSVRVFASRAEERRFNQYNADRRNW